MEQQQSFAIRPATAADMPQVCRLIKELAEFEKMPDQVRITPSILVEDGFSTTNPAFSCLVAETPDRHIAGYALYFTSYSTWLGKSIFLEDIYVQPAHRKTGIGRGLFMSVAKIAHGLPSRRMDFHVLSWNPATDFYRSLGAVNLTDIEKWQLYRLNADALDKLFDP